MSRRKAPISSLALPVTAGLEVDPPVTDELLLLGPLLPPTMELAELPLCLRSISFSLSVRLASSCLACERSALAVELPPAVLLTDDGAGGLVGVKVPLEDGGTLGSVELVAAGLGVLLAVVVAAVFGGAVWTTLSSFVHPAAVVPSAMMVAAINDLLMDTIFS
jgi:hypothetical protein